jgi:phage gp29-like protein
MSIFEKIFKKKQVETIQPINKPDSFSVKVNNPRWIAGLYTDEFNNLTKYSIEQYCQAARLGLAFWKALLFDEIRRRDLHIGGVCRTRKYAAINKQWRIECDQWDEGKKFIEECLEQINISNFAANVLEAQLQGVAIFELNWEAVNGKIIITGQKRIPNYLYVYNDELDEYKIVTAEMLDGFRMRNVMASGITRQQASIDYSQLQYVDVDEMKLVTVEASDSEATNGLVNGCIDALIRGYFVKYYAQSDWSTYLELFGNPLRVGKYDPLGADMRMKENFVTAVRDMGNLAYAVIPNTYEIEFKNDTSTGKSGEAFDTFIQRIDDSISINVVGQTLTTKTGDKGSYALGTVHNQVREDYMQADMTLIEETINKQIIKRLIDLNYPNAPEYPEFKYINEVSIDIKLKKSQTLLNVANMGFKINPDDIEEEFEVEVEEKQQQQTDGQQQIDMQPGEIPPGEMKFDENNNDEVEKYIEEIFKSVDDDKNNK